MRLDGRGFAWVGSGLRRTPRPIARPTTMAYAQVHDILARVRTVHKRLRRYCEQQRDAAEDEMVRELLDRVARREKGMTVCLARYTSEATPGILDTWIQYPGLEPVDEAVEAIGSAAHQSAADVVERVLACERTLADVYQDMADQAPGPHVREFLQNLQFLAAEQGRVIGRAVMDMRDLRSL
jgi:hypothetical protein